MKYGVRTKGIYYVHFNQEWPKYCPSFSLRSFLSTKSITAIKWLKRNFLKVSSQTSKGLGLSLCVRSIFGCLLRILSKRSQFSNFKFDCESLIIQIAEYLPNLSAESDTALKLSNRNINCFYQAKPIIRRKKLINKIQLKTKIFKNKKKIIIVQRHYFNSFGLKN